MLQIGKTGTEIIDRDFSAEFMDTVDKTDQVIVVVDVFAL